MSSKKVDNYEIIRVIGKGAFAIVYLGRNQKTKEIVAIKQILLEGGDSYNKEQLIKLYKSEIDLMQQLKHPNILELKEVQTTQDSISMILEYCSQGDLEKYIKQHSVKNRLPEEEARPIVAQIVDALKTLRLKNIVHRDLKLANILIDEQMRVKLADFGFAKLAEYSQLLESYCGTPITMAPEILKKGNYDSKCDIWSLGVMIFQMVFGNPPFIPAKGTIQDLLLAIETQRLVFPQHIPASNEMKDLLKLMLVVDPRKRMSYEDLFRHPWVNVGREILENSVLQPKGPQHAEIVSNIGHSINKISQANNAYVQKVVLEIEKNAAEMEKLPDFAEKPAEAKEKKQELQSLGEKLKNQTRNPFQSIKLAILYSNKCHFVELGNRDFKLYSLQEQMIHFMIDLYRFGVKNENIDLKSIFKAIGVPPNITNYFDVKYEQFSITIEEELRKLLNISNQTGQEIAMFPHEEKQFRQLDIELIQSLVKERYFTK